MFESVIFFQSRDIFTLCNITVSLLSKSHNVWLNSGPLNLIGSKISYFTMLLIKKKLFKFGHKNLFYVIDSTCDHKTIGATFKRIIIFKRKDNIL